MKRAKKELNRLYAVEGLSLDGHYAVKFGFARTEASCSRRIANAVELLRRNGFAHITQRNVWRGVLRQESEIHRILRRKFDNFTPINHSDGHTEAYAGLTIARLTDILPRAGVYDSTPPNREAAYELTRNVNAQRFAIALYVLVGAVVWPIVIWSLTS